jgi:hypothetical protein
VTVAYAVAVLLALSAWLVLSVLYQLRLGWVVRVKEHDWFGLIPRWAFFAPRPATSDYRVLYRDRLSDERLTEWREALVCGERGAWSVVWNPQKRKQKAVSDFLRSMTRAFRKNGGDAASLQQNLGYIGLLQLASRAAHDPASEATQFAIWQTYGFFSLRPARLVMHSRFHGLPSE